MRSGSISSATSRTSDQNAARASLSTEPEVSTMTASVAIASERIEGR